MEDLGRSRALVLSLDEKEKRGGGGTVQSGEFPGTRPLPSTGGSVLVAPFALLCWPPPLFIQPPSDLLNCC